MAEGFRHEAVFYDSPDGFVASTVPFVRDGLAADDAVLVVVDREKVGWLRDALGADAEAVELAVTGGLGHNPARIIPAWARFVADAHAQGRRPRGIGEPIGPRRTAAQLRECHLHEALLDTAFGGGTAWQLRCPYDTSALADDVLAEARRTHAFVDGEPSPAHRYVHDGMAFASRLSPPPSAGDVVHLDFDRSTLRAVRHLVARAAAAAGLGERTDDLVLAVNELATNSIRHGGGRGVVRAWFERRSLVIEVSDTGVIDDPLIGRVEPDADQLGGRGLWMCNQLCDLVQVHSSPAGTTVRVHVDLAVPAYVST